jgi:uncharacterized membrane protein YdbT with pleckstrin-like domain
MTAMHAIRNDTIESIGLNETKLYEVRKHWFGLVIVYLQVLVGFAAAVLLLWFLAPIIFPNADTTTRNKNLAIIIAVGAIVSWLILVLFTYIYRQSKLIISNKNLTQIVQRGLFSRQVSELSMADVEDISAVKHGILPSIFNYGDLLVETAGETDHFNFSFCPNPDFYGKIVLDAREKFIGSGTE